MGFAFRKMSKKNGSYGRLFLPSLTLSNFAIGPLGVLTGLLLIDIALTFKVPIGIMGQISTFSNIVAFISSLFMGVLSVRFKHKTLLLIGLFLTCISALGCFYSSNLSMMFLSYSISGVGSALVGTMSITLIGEHSHLSERGKAVGLVIAGGSLSYVIGAPMISYIANIWNWRVVILAFVIPTVVFSLLSSFVGIPSTSDFNEPYLKKRNLLHSFKAIFENRSANACLIGNILRAISFMAILIYGTSFYRQRYIVTTDFASIILLGAAVSYTLGSLIAGRLVNKYGRKKFTAFNVVSAGIFIALFVFFTNLWFSLILFFMGSIFSGMAASTATSLTLEQVPKHRGTLMALNSAALSLGSALGATIGGFLLLLYDYEILGSTLGILGIIAGIIFYFLSFDPSGKVS